MRPVLTYPRVLIAYERSGRVRRAFRARGVYAVSCDWHEADDAPGDGSHFTGDVLQEAIADNHWDAMIAFPPCTYLCSSGLHWNTRITGRAEKTAAALDEVRALMDAPIDHIAIENPRGRIATAIRPSDQTIQPYYFGDDASKETCLWLKNLPKLEIPHEERWIAPRVVKTDDGKIRYRWANQTDSGQNRLGPSPTRAYDRAKTYPGIAEAMAEQWTNYLRSLHS